MSLNISYNSLFSIYDILPFLRVLFKNSHKFDNRIARRGDIRLFLFKCSIFVDFGCD